MAISNPNTIKFSNEWIRPAADTLAREYYRTCPIVGQWNAMGGGTGAMNTLGANIQMQSRFFLENDNYLWRLEQEWLGWGSTVLPAGSGTINDGSVTNNDGRPVITTDQAITVITRARERVNWLTQSSGVFQSTTPLSSGGNNLNTLTSAANTVNLNNCGNAINRFTELKTRYEAGGNAVLNSILQVAVNPT